MKKIVLTGFALMLIASPALAADLRVRQVVIAGAFVNKSM
jgi:hypothetical protein